MPSPLTSGRGRQGVYRDVLVRTSALREGDWVRLKLKRGTFSKSGDARLSDEIYSLVEKAGQRWRIQDTVTGKAARRAYLPDEMVVVPKNTDVTPPVVERAVAAREAVDVGRTTRRLQKEARLLAHRNLVNTQPSQPKRLRVVPPHLFKTRQIGKKTRTRGKWN